MQVYKTSCKNCLLSKDRIVSPERAKELIGSCIKENTYFICHKSSTSRNYDVCCHTFFEKFKNKIEHLRWFIENKLVTFVDQPDTDAQLISYREIKSLDKKNEHQRI